MQTTYPSIGQIVIMVWFSISVIIAIVGTFVLWFWLRRRGIKLIFMLTATPGYLEYSYVKWCRSQGQHPKPIVLIFRTHSLMNAIVAGILFILFVATKQ